MKCSIIEFDDGSCAVLVPGIFLISEPIMFDNFAQANEFVSIVEGEYFLKFIKIEHEKIFRLKEAAKKIDAASRKCMDRELFFRKRKALSIFVEKKNIEYEKYRKRVKEHIDNFRYKITYKLRNFI